MDKRAWWRKGGNVALVVLFCLVCLTPWTTWFSAKLDLSQVLRPPSWGHPLGTDNLGRDLVVRIASALRGAVLPLWAGVLVASATGCVAGTSAICWSVQLSGRWLLPWLDLLAAAIVSVPVCLVAFAWAALQEQAGLGPVLLALCLVFTLRTYLQVRDLYRQDAQLAYWTAHAALGGSLLRRILGYGFGGSWRRPLAASLGFHLRTAVAIEASLSYLGFGIQEPSPSFGNMLAAHFDLYLKGQWYVLVVILLGLAWTAMVPQAALAWARGDAGLQPRVRRLP